MPRSRQSDDRCHDVRPRAAWGARIRRTIGATGADDPPGRPSTPGAGLITDLRKVARSVLLAFADLGIFLPSDRETIIGKARGLDPHDANEVAEFLGLCIDAGLITAAAADALRLCPDEAKKLAHSLDGHTPVPDEQAIASA